jgi:putative SOS response-associated peptidase YedK
LKSPYWRGWLKAECRCLVPATSFCEWTDTRPKVTHWFALDESRPLFAFAGIWRLRTGERKGDVAVAHDWIIAFFTRIDPMKGGQWSLTAGAALDHLRACVC